MDIKELNKSQLILLAVLLSFVTSIATGITTVTLMERAPTSFTAPINRVIKQTVENIQQVEGKTTTVVVKEEDLVVDALAKNQSSLFYVFREVTDDVTFKTTEEPMGRGFVVSTDGIVVVDGSLAPDKGVYYLKNDSGKFKANFISTNNSGFSFLKIGDAVDGKSKVVYTLPTFGDISKMKIGQKIIVDSSSVSSFMFDGNKDLRVYPTKNNTGTAMLDLDGNVLGFTFYSIDPPFIPINIITDTLKPVKSVDTTTPAKTQ
jgi:S1-C subfamily serine protease